MALPLFFLCSSQNPKVMNHVFDIEETIEKLRNSEKYWFSHIERENFEDTQSPHKSDEIYLILSGNGYLNIDGVDRVIQKNHSYFVPKNTQHYFHSNTEEIISFYVLN
jgi:mannose-6-phosphate isomerase-like protein (cupin superfamily)